VNIRHLFGAVTMAFVLLLAVSCGGRSDVEQNTAAFQTAANSYLKSKSMDMKVASFKELSVDGNTAKAVISLEHAEGAAGVKVRWTFTFEKQNDGTWGVVSHEQ